MDYNDYQLPHSGKIARAIGISPDDLDVPKDGMLSQPGKSKRPMLPLRKQRSSPSSDEKKPAAAAAAAAAARSAAMMRSTQAPFAASMHHPTSLQRLYAPQEPSMPLGGSPTASGLPPFILTSYGSMAGNPNFPHGSLMGGPSNFRPIMPSVAPPSAATSSFANPSQMEDVLVARQLAAMGRGPGIPSAAPVGPSQPHFSHDATFMARAMVAESERRRQQQHAAAMQAQAQAHAAQAQAMNIRFPPSSQQPGNEIGGSDSDILAAIQQRQRFLSKLESEFKAKMAGRGGGGGEM